MGRAAGPMTRTVADAALMMQVLAQPDARDSMSLPPQDDRLAALRRRRPATCAACASACCWRPAAACRSSPKSAPRVERRGARCSSTPARIVDADAALHDAGACSTAWTTSGACARWLDMQALPAPRAARKVLPYIRAWADSAAGFGGEHVFRAFSQFHATRVAAVAACAAFDYVISPTAPNCRRAGRRRPRPPTTRCARWSTSASPCRSTCRSSRRRRSTAATPPSGLPIGLQIAGQRFDDLGVLQVCRAFEQIRAPQRDWPRPPGG